jgi:hypothetical protein
MTFSAHATHNAQQHFVSVQSPYTEFHQNWTINFNNRNSLSPLIRALASTAPIVMKLTVTHFLAVDTFCIEL